MRAGKLFLVTILIDVAIGFVVHDWWRWTVIGTGVAFLCWGLLGSKIRRFETVVGCVITGFGLGMLDRHPILGALLGLMTVVLLWRPLMARRSRLKETI